MLGALRAVEPDLLADDVAIYTDGGGKRPAALVPLFGIERAMSLFRRVARLLTEAPTPKPSFRIIDGLPGYVTVELDGVLQTTAFDIRDGKVAAIYIVRNPEKLRHLDEALLQ